MYREPGMTQDKEQAQSKLRGLLLLPASGRTVPSEETWPLIFVATAEHVSPTLMAAQVIFMLRGM